MHNIKKEDIDIDTINESNMKVPPSSTGVLPWQPAVQQVSLLYCLTITLTYNNNLFLFIKYL